MHTMQDTNLKTTRRTLLKTGGTGTLTCDAPEQGSDTGTACFIGQDSSVTCTACAGVPACNNPCLNCAYRADSTNNSNCVTAGVPRPTECGS